MSSYDTLRNTCGWLGNSESNSNGIGKTGFLKPQLHVWRVRVYAHGRASLITNKEKQVYLVELCRPWFTFWQIFQNVWQSSVYLAESCRQGFTFPLP